MSYKFDETPRYFLFDIYMNFALIEPTRRNYTEIHREKEFHRATQRKRIARRYTEKKNFTEQQREKELHGDTQRKRISQRNEYEN